VTYCVDGVSGTALGSFLKHFENSNNLWTFSKKLCFCF